MSRIFTLANFIITLASADYTKWYFSSNDTCPGMGISCNAPSSMCAYDSVQDKYYCCSGQSYDICRNLGASVNDSSSQTECTSGSSTWYCLANSERCTTRTGQINVCVATQDNPIAAVSDTLMNETYSSLSSASPSASTFLVDVASLAARATATTSSISSTSPESTSLTSTSATDAATTSSSSDNSVSVAPGTIAGGVVGGVAGLAIIGVLAWFLLRRRARKTHSYEQPSSPTAAEYDGKFDPHGAVQSGYGTPTPQYHLAEMDGAREMNELEGKGMGPRDGAKELPSGQAEVSELPG